MRMKMLSLNFNLSTIDTVANTVLKALQTKTVLFYGDMGVGKTTFINALVKALGGKDNTTSPTFSLVNEYCVQNDLVYHFDFYRIENEIEVLDIGIEDYFYSGHWNFIEWPNKIKTHLPLEADILKLKLIKNNLRQISIINHKN